MSLIGEALKRAREHAARQGDAANQPPAPFPSLPPPRRERPRGLIAWSVATSLAVSLLVGGGLYLVLARPAAAPAPQVTREAPVLPPAAPAPPDPARAPTATRSQPAAAPARETTAARPSPPPSVSIAPPAVDPYPAPTPAPAMTPRPAPQASVAPAPSPRPPATTAARSGEPNPNGLLLPDGTRVTLDGIVWGESPIAMLNGRLMGAGERLGSYTLARIEQRRVTLLGDDGKTYVVDLAR